MNSLEPKNRGNKIATKRTETKSLTPNTMQLHPKFTLCRYITSELGMEVHCGGGQKLVSVLFVAVLITLFRLNFLCYLFI